MLKMEILGDGRTSYPSGPLSYLDYLMQMFMQVNLQRGVESVVSAEQVRSACGGVGVSSAVGGGNHGWGGRQHRKG